MEAFGKVHPTHRMYDQWMQMKKRTPAPPAGHGGVYIATAERFEHSAIFIHVNQTASKRPCAWWT